jgi:hypothetical protein
MSSPEIVNTATVAKRLGITPRIVDGLREAGLFPYYKLNRKTVRFEWRKVEAAFKACERKAITTESTTGKGRKR